jgi:hypothetical protein
VAEPPKPISVADLDLGTWTPEEGTAFEAAEWLMGSLIGWCSEQSAIERSRPRPDQERLAALDAERAGYARVRRSLSVDDPEYVQQVRAEYGPLALERFEAVRRSVD